MSGAPVANDVDVANELLVIHQEESAPTRLERGATLGGRPVDDGSGNVGEELPLTKPLRLERGGNDEQAAPDAAGVPERVADGDRLRGLAETHVVGQEQASPREEPLDAFALIGVERLLEGPQRTVQLGSRARGLDLAREPRALFLQQHVQCGLAVAVAKRGEQAIHQRQPLRRRAGNRDRPAVSVCWTQPVPQTAVRCAVDPANARQPVAKAGQRTDGIPAQRRRRSRLASRRRRDAASRRTSSRTATRCLHSPSEFRRKSAHSQLPSSGSIRRSSVRYGRARDPRRRVAYRPSSRPRGRPTI